MLGGVWLSLYKIQKYADVWYLKILSLINNIYKTLQIILLNTVLVNFWGFFSFHFVSFCCNKHHRKPRISQIHNFYIIHLWVAAFYHVSCSSACCIFINHLGFFCCLDSKCKSIVWIFFKSTPPDSFSGGTCLANVCSTCRVPLIAWRLSSY